MATPNPATAPSIVAPPPQVTAANPDSTGTGYSPDQSYLSLLGGAAGEIVGSPTGTSLIAGGLANYQAGQAEQQAKQLAGQITTPAAPFTNFSTQLQNQLTTGAPMSGPMGQTVASEQAAMQSLGQVANQYSTGQLQPWQVEALKQSTVSAMAPTNLAYAMSGGGDVTSAQTQAQQDIRNRALVVAGQIQQQNLATAAAALQTIQTTSTSLTDQALNAAKLGVNANTDAVKLEIQQNSAIAQSLNSLYGNLAKGITTAAGGTGTANQGMTPIQALLAKLGIGGGGSAPSADAASTAAFNTGAADQTQQWIGQTQAQTQADLQNTPIPNIDLGATDSSGIDWTSGFSDFSYAGG